MERDVQVTRAGDAARERAKPARKEDVAAKRPHRRQEELARKRMTRKKRKRQRILLLVGVAICLALAIICPGTLFFLNQKYANTAYGMRYETNAFTKSLYEDRLYASSLCVGTEKALEYGDFDSDWVGFHEEVVHLGEKAALFDVEHCQTLYSNKVFEKLYSASTTKLMTAYVTLKYGNLDDVVVVGRNATIFEPEAVLCGLQEGDQITLYDLLCGLLLCSGNDNAVAIAEHISGSVESFAELMNAEAWQLGATHSHFLNPHGLHEEEHYTTAYDLYLIFNACLQDTRFVEIISMYTYTGTMTGADGSVRYGTWRPSNYYLSGNWLSPDGIRVIGGKTGTTNEAGSCLVLYSVTSNSSDGAEHPYISIVMGAPSKPHLYNTMDILLDVAIVSANDVANTDSSSGVDSSADGDYSIATDTPSVTDSEVSPDTGTNH